MSFAVAQYSSARIATASPLSILIRLYDGAIAFLIEAQDALEHNDIPKKAKALNRAHAIVSELMTTLDVRQAPELCAQLSSLYDFVLHQISKANLEKDADALGPAVRVLRELRSAWAALSAEGG